MKLLLFAIITFILIIFLQYSCSSEIETTARKKLNLQYNILGSRLGNLIRDLGEPKTIDQLDNVKTLFYWENKGIIVFCHPLFRHQYERKERNDFTITSLFVARCYEVTQNIVPSADTILKFKYLLIENTDANDKNKDKFEFTKPDYFLDYD